MPSTVHPDARVSSRAQTLTAWSVPLRILLQWVERGGQRSVFFAAWRNSPERAAAVPGQASELRRLRAHSEGMDRLKCWSLLIGSRRLLRRRMKRVYDRHSWVMDERRVDARHLPLRAAGTHRAIIRTVRRWDAERISRDAHLIKQPALLLWGENDLEIPLADGERLHAEIPVSRLIVFLNCGHIPHEEYPEAFTNVVTDFCKAQSA